MPRPRRDGTPPSEPRRLVLSDLFLKRLKPQSRAFMVWDQKQRGLGVSVQPTRHMAWKCVYAFHGRPRWYHLGDCRAIGLADARKLASRIMFQVAEGKDPCAERKAERGKGTFDELAARYLEEHAKRRNRSWKQADALVRKHLLPRWGKLAAAHISRTDVKAMMGRIEAPIVANQVLASASAIFAWAIHNEVLSANPCQLVERNPTKSRERVLSESEIPKFWAAFNTADIIRGTALKMILLTGQRPGEVLHMRREHLEDGWWTMPGEPVPALGWPGTKNKQNHRVWVPEVAQALLAKMGDGGGPLFAGRRGLAPKKLDSLMRAICREIGVERATPHDLRRTHGTTITSLGFGRDAMNRIQNHKEGGIASVYDRHQYSQENRRVMEAAASRILSLVEDGAHAENVIAAQFKRKS